MCDGSEDQKWAEEEGREDGTIVHPVTGMCLESGEKCNWRHSFMTKSTSLLSFPKMVHSLMGRE